MIRAARLGLAWLAVVVSVGIIVFAGISSPAGAALSVEQQARCDFEVFGALVGQERALMDASVAIEDYAAGRINLAEARNKLKTCQINSKKYKQQVYAPQTVGSSEYMGMAKSVANKRELMIEHAVDLLKNGEVSRSNLQGFQVKEGRLAADSAKQLINGRAKLAAGITKHSTNKKISAYYIWYTDLAGYQLREIALSLRIRTAMNALAAKKKANVTGLHKEGKDIANGISAIGKQIGRKVKKVLGVLDWRSKLLRSDSKSEPSIANANDAAVKEAKSLAKLAEATELLAKDNSADAVSRFNRHSEAVRADSIFASNKSLAVLERALNKYE